MLKVITTVFPLTAGSNAIPKEKKRPKQGNRVHGADHYYHNIFITLARKKTLQPLSTQQLIIIRILRIRQVKHDSRMRLRPAPARIRSREVDGAVEVQRPVGVDVDVQTLVVGGCIDEADVARLQEVVGDDDVFLVRGHFDVVGADGRLDFGRVVEAFDVGEVRDVEGGDVVAGCVGC